MDIFERLAPFIQDYIYNAGWTEFRGIQVAAGDVIFNTDDHLLLTSGTSSGKTEAAFLPVLTLLYENPSKSIGVLYVSPLKALINDQFIRLNDLLEYGGINVCKWHGDASISAKNKVLAKPEGVLQITPESLESLMTGSREDCIRLFNDLRFIIVDEVHYFMAGVRGIQLSCLLERVERLAACRPRRIGLSATINEFTSAENWLCAGSLSGKERKCRTPVTDGGKRRLRVSMQRFAAEEDEVPEEFYDFIYEKTLNKKSIIFATSRAEVEDVVAKLRKIAAERKTPDIYRIHHGSISKALREETERDMKRSEAPIVTGATVTLELGIDIGSLDMIVQVGAPLSASSLTQRIGRSGRRGQTADLVFAFIDRGRQQLPEFMEYNGKFTFIGRGRPSDEGGPLDGINWELIKTIAILQLFLEGKWVEPVTPPKQPFSLLYHQTMCLLLAESELSPRELARSVLSLSAFRAISQSDYQLLLRHLLDIGHLQRMENGNLIIGAAAEPIVTNYRFLAVFEAETEYEVKHEGETIGSVMEAYPVGTIFALAGRTWQTVEINERSKMLIVQAAEGVSKIAWISTGRLDQHSRVLQKMREVLCSDEVYSYLSEDCAGRLEQIRGVFRASGLASRSLISVSRGRYAFFPWLGTKQINALLLILRRRHMQVFIRPGGFSQVYLDIECESFGWLRRVLSEVQEGIRDNQKAQLTGSVNIPGKFNRFIPKELLLKEFLEDYIDVGGIGAAFSK